MAAPMQNMLFFAALYFSVFFSTFQPSASAEKLLFSFDPTKARSQVENSCVLSLVSTKTTEDFLDTFFSLQHIFREEDGVTIATVDDGFDGKNIQWESEKDKNAASEVVFFPRLTIDRTCLLKGSNVARVPRGVAYAGPVTVEALVSFVNSHCGTYRKKDGTVSVAGLHRQEILQNLFRVESISDVIMEDLYSADSVNPFQTTARWPGIQEKVKTPGRKPKQCDTESSCDDKIQEQTEEADSDDADKYSRKGHVDQNQAPTIAKCETINLESLSPVSFFHEYVKRSRPVVIKKAVSDWPAYSKWTMDFFRENFGNKSVHIKLTPGGDFEGVEKAELWEDHGKFQIPEEVLSQLPYPDLVVVRPAGINMNFSDFLDLITYAGSQAVRNVSAYLEYSSILQYMPQIQADLLDFPFAESLLTRKHLNLWLSDGNTVGRLHFDPFDNLLCQLRGQKQVLLFEPFDNSKFYEAHIPQATLSYSKNGHRFKRKKLEDSTSMVMSPVDILDPDLQRFPKFAGAQPLNCTIDEGDVLFMPSFWWHEVYSLPNTEEKRNLAVNYWYEPFLKKDFPCMECPLDVNPHYRHLL